MKLTLLLVPEDFVMQILWKKKSASLKDIQKNWIAKKKPTLKQIEISVNALEEKKFIVRTLKQGSPVFSPHPSRASNIRFRANYDLVGYFNGSMRQLDKFLDEYEVDGMIIHDGLEGMGSSLLYPSLVRNYYQVTYPKAVINTLQLGNAFVKDYLKTQKSRRGRFLVLGHSKLKGRDQSAVIVVAKDIAKVHKIKVLDPKVIMKDKTIVLHEEALQ